MVDTKKKDQASKLHANWLATLQWVCSSDHAEVSVYELYMTKMVNEMISPQRWMQLKMHPVYFLYCTKAQWTQIKVDSFQFPAMSFCFLCENK